MKKFVLGLFVAASLTSFSVAGDSSKMLSQPVIEDKVVETSLFRDRETSFDVFGAYVGADSGRPIRSGFGGGLGVNHFFTRYIGVGVEGELWDNGGNDVAGAVNASIIARYPIELFNQALAPYVFGGGGGVFVSGAKGEGHAGGGLEWRFNPNWSIFGDGRYVFVSSGNDYALARTGLRYIF